MPNLLKTGWVVLGTVLSARAEASCAESTGADVVQDALDRAETALTQLDIEAFKRNVREAEALLPCVGAPLSPALAAEFHRFWALRAFGDRDPLARAGFAAARHLEPNYRFPETLIPSGNPVLQEYAAVDLSTRVVAPVEAPADGSLAFDGVPGLERPVAWPVIVQHLTPTGVGFTAFLRPDAPVPDYVTLSERPPVVDPPARSAKVPLLVGVAAGALASGSLYGAALAGEARYKSADDPVPDAELPGLRSRTNALVVASAVTATATAGASVALALAW